MTSSRHNTTHPFDISLEVDRLGGLVTALGMVCRAREETEGEFKASVEALQHYLEDEVGAVRNACRRYEENQAGLRIVS